MLREVDRRLGLTAQVARRLGDARQRGKVRHEVLTMLRQRVHGLALGYEDLNDHDTLRDDLVVQTACGRVLRIGAVAARNTRTVAVRLSGACPDQAVFRLLVQRLTAG